jgi:hypothetical protein
VLTRVDQHLGSAYPEAIGHGRRLHELRPIAYYGEYPHESGVGSCLDMSILLDNVRGTVHGVLAGFGHVLWYVDWHTGGQATRPR